MSNFEDYATGGRSFSTPALACTLLAAHMSGMKLVQTVGGVFTDGLIAATMVGSSVGYLLTGFFIAPQVVHFPDCVTLGDLMGRGMVGWQRC